ncbi:unnamed protein product [Rotaria sp. Silwood2]|nr:unnamed protein product [Rotaria sp. Silwood2]CAF4095621.1 unnamed protein product [Rotaria sp. Silwood2]
MQRAEQIMLQSTIKQEYDQFNDDIDDDELCKVNWFIYLFFLEILLNIYLQTWDELYNSSQVLQSQQNKLSNIEQNENLIQNSNNGLKRKRLGVSTTPNECRTIIKKH